MLNIQVVVLRIGRFEVLFRYRKYGKRRSAERVRKSNGRRTIEVSGQVRRIEKDVAGNVTDQHIIKNSVAGADYGLVVASETISEADARSEVVVIGIVDSAN